MDRWVASVFKKTNPGEAAVIKMSKTGDVGAFGSHQTKDKNHLEERLLDQAQARASYYPLFGGSFA